MAEREIRIPIVGDSSQLKRELDKAARELDGFGGNAKKLATNFNREFLLLGGGIAAGLGLAVKSAMDFDKQMSEVGATADASGDQLDKLRDAAIKAGAATVFNAQEAAAAESELAKAGLEVSDILGGGLKGALDLAAAGSLQVADAAEIASQAMAQFQLSGSDVPRIADALAAGANKALGGVEDLGQGLGEVGGTANSFGLSLEETTGVLALFAQNGQLGAEGGTALKTALLRLGAPTDAAKRAMDELGLSFYDANGQFVGISDAAEQLKSKLSGLTEEQRNQALETIFGQRAIKGATILMQEGAAGVDQWTAAVSESGYASELAGKKTDNLAGDLEQLRGSLETALIQGGSQATTALRGMATALTNVVNGLAEMPGPLQTAFLGSAGILSVGSLGIGIYGTFAPKIAEVKKALEGMGTAGQFVARNMGAITAATGGVTFVLAAVAGAYGLAQRKAQEFAEQSQKFKDILQELGGATEGLDLKLRQAFADNNVGELIVKSGVPVEQFTDAVRNAGTELDKFGNATGWSLIQDKLQSAAEKGNVWAQSLLDAKDAGNLSGIQVEDLVKGLDFMNDTLDTGAQDLDIYNQLVGDTGDASGDAATSVDGLALSQEDAAAAAEEHTRQLEAQYTAITTLAGGDVALKQAQIAAREELQTYNETMADATASADDREKAGLDLIDAFLRESDAAVGLARDQAEAAGETLGASEATDIQRQALEYLRDTLAPGDPLRAQLQGYIDQLNTIPPEKQTEINAETAEAKRRLDEILGKLREVSLGARFTVNGNVVTAYSFGAGNIVPEALAPRTPSAMGTSLASPNNPRVVGERGPELFWPDSYGSILTAQQTRGVMGGGGGSVVISGPVYIDARDKTGEQILEELMKVAKVNGPLPIPIAA